MSDSLMAGDILSYSAGTTQRGPDGFRFLRRAGVRVGADMLGAVAGRWPDLIEWLGDEPPLVLNGYPAATGDFSFGIQVDCYLSVPVALRALRLARRERLTVIVLAQPLWVAELLVQARAAGDAMPANLILALGGYPLPRSLERAYERWCGDAGTRVAIIQLYGVAELDAGCLLGRERDGSERVIFYPRPDVRVGLDEGELVLSIGSDESGWGDPVRTGDRAEFVGAPEDGGLIVPVGTRVNQGVASELESWADDSWERRTGYLRRDGDALRAQLRAGVDAAVELEEDHYDFARHTRASYLTKPDWRCD